MVDDGVCEPEVVVWFVAIRTLHMQLHSKRAGEFRVRCLRCCIEDGGVEAIRPVAQRFDANRYGVRAVERAGSGAERVPLQARNVWHVDVQKAQGAVIEACKTIDIS